MATQLVDGQAGGHPRQPPVGTVRVQIRTVYGVDTVYPACPQAVLLAQLAGHKTLADHDLRIVKQLGFDIQVEAPQRSGPESAASPADR